MQSDGKQDSHAPLVEVHIYQTPAENALAGSPVTQHFHLKYSPEKKWLLIFIRKIALFIISPNLELPKYS